MQDSIRIVVAPTLAVAPSAVRFSHIKTVIQGTCVQCHSPTGTLPRPPVFWADTDRNGDGAIDATDQLWLYTDVKGRINFTELAARVVIIPSVVRMMILLSFGARRFVAAHGGHQ